jgi:hypothetical protein
MHASRTLLRTAVLALCALPMHGSQTANTGAIAGTVSDPSGALVPRAAVAVKSQGTGESAISRRMLKGISRSNSCLPATMT